MRLIEPPVGLEQVILASIRRLIRRRLAYWISLSVASLGATIAALVYLLKALSQSGFGQYLSLIWSDKTMVLTYGKELGLTLVESLPVLELAIFCVVIGIFVWSFTQIIKNKPAYSSSPLWTS